MSPPVVPWYDVIRRARGGDGEAMDQLYRELQRVIQSRVAMGLASRRAGPQRGDLRQDVADLCQQIWAELLENGWERLLRWDPAAGRSLANYVGWLAERRTYDHLGKVGKSIEDLLADDADPPEAPTDSDDSPEHATMDREMAERVYERLVAEVSPAVLRLFHLVMAGQDTDEIGALLDMSPDAVQKARDRLHKLIRQIQGAVMKDGGPGRGGKKS